jgi:tetratricopeptide (TPR) repeat protein
MIILLSMSVRTGSSPVSGGLPKFLGTIQRMGLVVCQALICLGTLTSSAAFGSHLSLPGSQDLHQTEDSDQQSLTRQLETINSYTPPHASSNRDEEIQSDSHALPIDKSLPINEPSSDESSFLPPAKATKPGGDSAPGVPSTDWKRSAPLSAKVHQHLAQDHSEIGWMFLLSGRFQAATAAYREALRHHPDSATAYIGMGMVLKSLGKTEPAKQAIQHALRLNPRLSSALVHLGYLYADGRGGHSDSARARRLFKEAFQLGDPFAGIALLDLQSRARSK